MKVVWSQSAIAQLTEIYGYIARDSEQYARHMVDRITSRSKQIDRFPESGEMVPEYDDPCVREVIEGPYRVIYEIASDRVVVLAVIHGSRMLPSSLSEEDS